MNSGFRPELQSDGGGGLGFGEITWNPKFLPILSSLKIELEGGTLGLPREGSDAAELQKKERSG